MLVTELANILSLNSFELAMSDMSLFAYSFDFVYFIIYYLRGLIGWQFCLPKWGVWVVIKFCFWDFSKVSSDCFLGFF